MLVQWARISAPASTRRNTIPVSGGAGRIVIGKEGDQQLPRQGMTGADALEMADNRTAGKIQIADCIEQLVADELVGVAQPALVEDGVAADHDRVVERAAAGQPGGA